MSIIFLESFFQKTLHLEVRLFLSIQTVSPPGCWFRDYGSPRKHSNLCASFFYPWQFLFLRVFVSSVFHEIWLTFPK